MERTFLYYPTINIPDMKWLYSSILYSDKVSSIVPFYNTSDSRFPDFLQFLIDENQYKPIFIKKLLNTYDEEFKEFEDFFINTTNSVKFRNMLDESVNLPFRNYDTLYGGKMTQRIDQYLHDSGFIKDIKDDQYITDEIVSLFYMSILAQYVAKISKDDLIIPSTGDKRYHDIGFNNDNYKEPAMSFLLENCLPTPDENTPIKKIIQFKKTRRDELLEFRKHLSTAQEKIQKATEKQEVIEIQIGIKENIEKGIKDLDRLCKENSIKTFFSSFESLLKLDNPKLFQTLTVTGVVSTPIHPALGLSLGLISVAGGVVSSYYSKKKEIDNSELTYLFKATQEGILKPLV